MSKEALEKEKAELRSRIKEIDQEINKIKEKELAEAYGDKYTCEFCRYRAVHSFSGDGWHNTCGADNCTCCHSVCEKYKPDNAITQFIKSNINTTGGIFRCKHTAGYGHISDEEYRALDELGLDIFKIEDEYLTKKAINALVLLFDIKN